MLPPVLGTPAIQQGFKLGLEAARSFCRKKESKIYKAKLLAVELTKTASHALSVSDPPTCFWRFKGLPLQLQASGSLHVVLIFSAKPSPFSFSAQEPDLLKFPLLSFDINKIGSSANHVDQFSPA